MSEQPGDMSHSGVCPQCKGSQWLRRNVPYGHPQFGKPTPCECLVQKRREQRRLQLISLSGLPDLPHLPTLGSFLPHMAETMEAFRVVCTYVDLITVIQEDEERSRRRHLQELGWIVLIGPVGVGKTHLAIAAAQASIDAGIVTLFTTAPDLLDHLRATFKPEAEVLYDKLFERMRTAELLVLDDLGTQRSSPWANEKLFQLLNHRYTHRLPTIVTLNRKAWEQLDERLRSRLSDQGLVQLVNLQGAADYRQKREEPFKEEEA